MWTEIPHKVICRFHTYFFCLSSFDWSHLYYLGKIHFNCFPRFVCLWIYETLKRWGVISCTSCRFQWYIKSEFVFFLNLIYKMKARFILMCKFNFFDVNITISRVIYIFMSLISFFTTLNLLPFDFIPKSSYSLFVSTNVYKNLHFQLLLHKDIKSQGSQSFFENTWFRQQICRIFLNTYSFLKSNSQFVVLLVVLI